MGSSLSLESECQHRLGQEEKLLKLIWSGLWQNSPINKTSTQQVAIAALPSEVEGWRMIYRGMAWIETHLRDRPNAMGRDMHLPYYTEQTGCARAHSSWRVGTQRQWLPRLFLFALKELSTLSWTRMLSLVISAGWRMLITFYFLSWNSYGFKSKEQMEGCLI